MSNNLTEYYQHIQTKGNLPTITHARRWSTAVLKTLGLCLDRGTKKQLARALPAELAESLTRVFWLVHFRDKNLSRDTFQNQVARRSGNSDTDFARYPTIAVFGGIKNLVSDDVTQKVAQSLPPEVRELWQQG